MALYDLVTLKRSLQQKFDITPTLRALSDLQTQIANIEKEVDNLSDHHRLYIQNLVKTCDQFAELFAGPSQDLTDKIAEIDAEIAQTTHNLFAGNYDLENIDPKPVWLREHRRLNISSDVEMQVKQRLLLHTNWRYPSLEIGCQDGDWTQYLVAADPLYVMDRSTEFLDATSSRFTPEYQRRLRKYPLVNHDLSALPENQFAFVFSWNYFNYVSLDTMKQYLQQIMQLLRPGGVFMFTFNDGDTPAGAGMAEHFARTYMPSSMLTPMCESLGYITNPVTDLGPGITWLEIHKPGDLQTIKAHQALGEIRSRISG
jgi:SAM-dependent methyltransferase